MSDFADHLLGYVRTVLRQHPPFRGMTRDDLDNAILADLERDIRRELADWIAATEYEIRDEIMADIEFEAEMEAAAKKAKRPKRKQEEELHEDHRR